MPDYEVFVPISGANVYKVSAKNPDLAKEYVASGATDEVNEIVGIEEDLDTNNWEVHEIH